MTTLALDRRRVSVLFAHRRSPYFDLPVDVYDERRDVMSFTNRGGGPVIAHPPCRLWSRMRAFSTAPSSERAYAFFSLALVRVYGGVLEQPAYSLFWKTAGLPDPRATGASPQLDQYGGWSIAVSQKWWGHLAEKPTWLYVVGCKPADLPEIPYCILPAKRVCATSRTRRDRSELSPAQRDLTPIKFAWWLEELASRCRRDIHFRASSAEVSA